MSPFINFYFIMNNNSLQEIVNHLILHASFIPNLGLFHGKMGIVLFFFHYSRYTNDELYEDFAGELLDEIYQEIHDRIPLDLESGLCGIGWGIEYLLKKEFVEGDSMDILEDIDKKVMTLNLHRMEDRSLETGLLGFFHYIAARLLSTKDGVQTPFDSDYLLEIKSVANKICQDKNENDKLLHLVDYLIDYHPDKSNLQYKTSLLHEIYTNFSEKQDIKEMGYGLQKGYAGLGMKLINGK